jgi:DNA-binding transcriptional LysR family regulator
VAALDLYHLRNFIAVCDHLNITHAARYVNLSQPALSRQIKDLETELNVKLFARRTDGLHLTAPGRALAKEAASLLQRTDLLVKTMAAFTNPSAGHFSIGYDLAALSPNFFGTLARFSASHAETELSVREHNALQLLSQLHTGTFDLIVLGMSRDTIPDGCNGVVVSQETLSLVVGRGHALADQPSIRLSEVAREPLVSFQDEIAPIWNSYILNACGLAGFEPNRTVRVNSHGSMLDTISACGGYALLPTSKSQNLGMHVISIPITYPVVAMDLCAVWSSSSTCCVLPAFVDMLLDNSAVSTDYKSASKLRDEAEVAQDRWSNESMTVAVGADIDSSHAM